MEKKIDTRLREFYFINLGIWPIELTSGVAFYFGLRITQKMFLEYSRLVGFKK